MYHTFNKVDEYIGQRYRLYYKILQTVSIFSDVSVFKHFLRERLIIDRS